MGPLEQMVVLIINWGVAPTALGVGFGAELMKAGMGGVVPYQELGHRGDLASQ